MSRGAGAGAPDRPVCWSGTGSLLAAPAGQGVKLVDVRGGARRVAPLAADAAFRFVQEKLVVTGRDGGRAVGITPDHDRRVVTLDAEERASFCATAWGPALVASSPDRHRVAVGTGHAHIERLAPADRLVAVLPDQSAVIATGAELVLARAGRRAALELPGELLQVDVLLGGRALAVLTAAGPAAVCSVLSAAGELLRRVELPGMVGWTVAGLHALAVMLGEEGGLHAIDLRIGRVRWARPLDLGWTALALHPRATSVAGLRATGEIDVLSVSEL